MNLYINTCVRNGSRTDKIARALIEKIGEPFDELYLPEEAVSPLDRDSLEKRTRLIEACDYSDPMFRYAKAFANADQIVLSAPFWDLSFPSVLKVYLENIYVTGIVSQYGADGQPHGLCKAKTLYYVTTAGGAYTHDYSYDYIRELATVHFGIGETRLIKAEMLDVEGFDADEIVQTTIEGLDKIIA